MRTAVIFDMDGVLVDSQPFHFEVDFQVLQKAGVVRNTDGSVLRLEQTFSYAGMATRDRWAKYRRDFNIGQSVEELAGLNAETLSELLEQYDLQPISGINELIAKLRGLNVSIAVASSSSEDFIDKMLNKIGLTDFDVVLSGENMRHSKPAPDIFLAAAEALGKAPQDCVVIEDSANGVAAAVAAGIKCVGYRNLNSGNQDIGNADIIIDDFVELADDTAWLY